MFTGIIETLGEVTAIVAEDTNLHFTIKSNLSNELKIDQMKLIHVNGLRIVIGKTENGLVAFDDRCTHRGASLADGVMICGTVQCPWHGSQFDTTNGHVKAGPADKKITIYRLEEREGNVYLKL